MYVLRRTVGRYWVRYARNIQVLLPELDLAPGLERMACAADVRSRYRLAPYRV